MQSLSPGQLKEITQYIRQTRPHPALQAELIDHLASLIERRMHQGEEFRTAFQELVPQASLPVMQQLNQQYNRTFNGLRPTVHPYNRRVKHRLATKPFYYMYLSSGLTLLLLIVGFLLLIGRPLSLSDGVFQPTWGIAMAAVGAVGLVRWWLKKRLTKHHS